MKIDSSSWDQPVLDGVIRRPGRPRSVDPLVFVTVGLTAAQWRWLSSWFPGGSPTAQMRELFTRAMKFWPSGPHKFR